MPAESISEEAALLAQKEQWAQTMADVVCSLRGIERDVALASARWAILWIEDFNTLVDEKEPFGEEEVKEYLEASRASSLERSVGLTRYPSGAMTIRGVIAAHDVFCAAFGEEAEEVRELLETSSE